MAKYHVTLAQVSHVTYEVEANSLEEAIYKAGYKEDADLIQTSETDENDIDVGMSFDEAKDMGIDTEYIVKNYNENRRNEHIEGLIDIKLAETTEEEK